MSPQNGTMQSLTADTYKYQSWKQLLDLLSLPEIPLDDVVINRNDADVITSVNGKARLYNQPAHINLALQESGNKKAFTLAVGIQQLPLNELLSQVGLNHIYEQLTGAGLLPGIVFEEIKIEADTAENSISFSSVAGTNEWSLPGFEALKLLQLSFTYHRSYSRITKLGSGVFTLGGRIKIGEILMETSVQVFTDRPHFFILRTKQETSIQKNLDEISSFLLGQPVSSLLPSSFNQVPGIYLSDLYAAVDLKGKKITSTGITLEVKEPWTIAEGICRTGRSSLSLRLENSSGNINSLLAISGEVSLLESLHASLLFEIENLTANWTIQLNAGLQLPRLKDIDALLGLSALNNSGLPPSLLEQPLQVDVNKLKIQFSPAEKTFNEFALDIASEQLWEIIPGIKVGNTAFQLQWTKRGNALTGSVSGELLLGDNLKIELSGKKLPGGFVMEGAFTTETPLKLTEALTYLFPGFRMPADLLEVAIENGSVKIDTANGTFDLEINSDSYLNLAPLARLESKKLTVSYEKGERKCTVSTEGAFRLIQLSEGSAEDTYLLNVEGTLTVEMQKDHNSVGFESDEDKSFIELPTLIPGRDGQNVALRFGLKEIKLEQEEGKGWKFTATTETQLKNLNKNIASILPEKTTAQLSITKKEQKITVDQIVEPLTFTLPEVEFPAGKIKLGTMAIGLSNFTFALRKKVEASVDIALGLPSDLNYMFGAMPDPADASKKKPAFELFRTYAEGDKDSFFRLTFTATSSGGVKLTLANSPFKIKAFEIKNGYWHCNLGDYGKLKILLPVLSYENGAFSGEIGFEREGELKFPMYLFKQIIKDQLKFAKAAELIPDALPITNIPILNDKGHLNVDTILDMLNLKGEDNTSKVVRSIISAIDGVLDELPQRLRDVYMKQLAIPEKFYAKVAVTADGGVNIDMAVEGDKAKGTDAIRLLFPAAMGPLPVLNGIELRGFSVGTTMGGNLLTCSMDMTVDQFDLLALGFSLLRATTPWKESLPDARQVQRTYTVSKLSMIIIYQTYVPIPIPVFYDELGYDYCGIEGVRIGGHIKFPQPKLNIVALVKRISDLVRFFKEPAFPLPEKLPEQEEELNFRFTVSETYLKMPEYLGGAVIGRPEKDFFKLDGYELVSKILNHIKFFSVNKLIQTLPIDWRINSAKTPANSFGIDAALAYAVTTPEEFLQNREVIARILSSLDMPGADSDMPATLQSFVPATVTKDTQGMIALVNGQLDIASVLQLKSRFGLAVIQNQGFATYLQLHTSLLNLFETKLEGLVVVDTHNKENPVVVKGKALMRFPIFDHTLMEGELAYPAPGKPQTFYFSGKFNLLPPGTEVVLSSPAEASAQAKVYISRNEFLLDEASMRLQLPGLGELYAATTIRINATEQVFFTTATIWGKRTSLYISNTATGGFYMKGEMDKIDWLAGWLVLEAAEKDGRGPGMLVAVNKDKQLTDLYVSARVSLFKLISAAIKLELKNDMWNFDLESTTSIAGIESRFVLACKLKSDYSRLTADSKFTIGFRHEFARKSFWLYSIFTRQWYEVVVFDGFTISGGFEVGLGMDVYNPSAADDSIRRELDAVKAEVARMTENIRRKKEELAPKANGYKRLTDDAKKYQRLLELQRSITNADTVKRMYELKQTSGGDPESKKQFLRMKESMLLEINDYLALLPGFGLGSDTEKKLYLYRLDYIDRILWNASARIGSNSVKQLLAGGEAPDYDFVQIFFAELVQLKKQHAAQYIPGVFYNSQEVELNNIAEQLTDMQRTRDLFESYINHSSDPEKKWQFEGYRTRLLSLLDQYIEKLNAIGFSNEDEKRLYITRLYVLDRVIANFLAYGSHVGTIEDIVRAMDYLNLRDAGHPVDGDEYYDMRNRWLLVLAGEVYRKKIKLVNERIQNHFMLNADDAFVKMTTLDAQMKWLNEQVVPDMVEMKAMEEKQKALQARVDQFAGSRESMRISMKFNSRLTASINGKGFEITLPEIALYVGPKGNSMPDLLADLQAQMVSSIADHLWEIGKSIITGKPVAGRPQAAQMPASLMAADSAGMHAANDFRPEGYDPSLDLTGFIGVNQ